MRGKRVTLRDIAIACEADISTVSRALRGDERVKATTREQILQAASQLGYRPNLAARTLQAGKSDTIWFLLPGLESNERLPAEMASLTLADRGYDTLIAILHHQAGRAEHIFERLQQGVADGALLIPGFAEKDRATLRKLSESGFPMVVLDRSVSNLNIPLVTSENKKGGSDLIYKLQSEGVQQIIMEKGPDKNDVLKARAQGVNEALFSCEIQTVISEGAGQLNTNLCGNVVGVYANSAEDARRIIHAHAEQLKDRKVIAAVFDGWPADAYPADKVYTCIQNFPEMGRIAAEVLLNWIETREMPKIKTYKVPMQSLVMIG